MTTTAVETCRGNGTHWISNATSRTNVPCSSCHQHHPPVTRPAAPAGPSEADVRAAAVQEGVLASYDPATRKVGTVLMPPKPYFVRHDNPPVDVPALEAERTALIASLPGLDFTQRTRTQTRITEIERALTHERKVDESSRRDAERVGERARARGEQQFLTPRPPEIPEGAGGRKQQ